ncbi:hypothetical protein GCM10009828_095530 [Actinoplanes couchii]|uniref:Plasmid pRiA4b Orf3-like domain-containing protein n=1 Tax=Actinoplanes couchii TaxID=403638 RepID=A0ABQ3XEE4_9ACTN|nr:hypothetical protein Aco03nite_051940 [Actinoplanes couchii]
MLRAVAPVPEICDCPSCSGESPDVSVIVDDLLLDGADLLGETEPIEAELFAAALLGVGDLSAEGITDVLVDDFVPLLENAGTPEAVAVLLSLGAVSGRPEAGAAAGRLTGRGVPAPAWADELREPVRPGDLLRFTDDEEARSILVGVFERAGQSHGFAVTVDHEDCHAATAILLFPGEVKEQVTDTIRAAARAGDVALSSEILAPAEFRWLAEQALGARADHDAEIDDPEQPADDTGDSGPGYHTSAALLRSRLRSLPEPDREPAPHGDEPFSPEDIEIFARIVEDGRRTEARAARRRATAGPKLPAKRKMSDGPAPILQLKVSLLGARPPIWRRLEVPADTSLAVLHENLQAAFGWDDSHLHAFETGHGAFARSADPDLGHRPEKPVTLKQVAPQAGARLLYRYDFGDDWRHQILVEKVLDRQDLPYPRCTGGRRAAPFEDCGGIWGYQELVDVLADPDHPDHADQLDWLGLDSAADFDPAHFEAAEITRRLTAQR